jgi:hypothetical protein
MVKEAATRSIVHIKSNRITSPCSKQKEKPAQNELAKGFTAVLPWQDHRAGV